MSKNAHAKTDALSLLSSKRSAMISVASEEEIEVNNFKHINNDALHTALKLHNQSSSMGNKLELLARVSDGEHRGQLGTCLKCNKGKLRVASNNFTNVHCPGHFDTSTKRMMGCNFVCNVNDAPRVGAWLGKKYFPEPLSSESLLRLKKRKALEQRGRQRQDASAKKMRAMFAANVTVSVGSLVTVWIDKRDRAGPDARGVVGVVFEVKESTGGVAVCFTSGVLVTDRKNNHHFLALIAAQC